MWHSPHTVNLTTGSERELLGSVINELVKWGGWAMRIVEAVMGAMGQDL
jgi:hypothetical protein